MIDQGRSAGLWPAIARRRRKGDPYRWTVIRRTEALRSLGFWDYAAYLKSDLWRWIRRRYLAHHHFCRCCDNPATEIHHMDYEVETLSQLRPKSLMALCRECHQNAEYDPRGKKRRQHKVNAILIEREGQRQGWARKPKEKKKPRKTNRFEQRAEWEERNLGAQRDHTP